MAYEVRIDGRPVAQHSRQRDAMAHVREAVRRNSNVEPEIVDSETGRPVEPSATVDWREDLANKVGY